METLQRLLVIEDVRALMAHYVGLADRKDWHGIANLYTGDGVFETHQPDGTLWLRMSGHEEIETTFAAASGAGDVLIHHLLSYEIDVHSPDAAHGVFTMEDMIIRPDDAELPPEFAFRTMHGYGHYHGDFVRTEDGWRVQLLMQTRARLEFTP
jgi:hypothetical protein